MFKVALIGGLLAAFSMGSFSLGELFLYVIGAGVALLVLAFALEISVAVLERLGYPWDGMRLSASERLERSRQS